MSRTSRSGRVRRIGCIALAATVLGSPWAQAAPTAEPTTVRGHQASLGLHATPTLGLETSYGRRLRLRWRSALTPRASLGFPLANVADGRSWDAALGTDWFVPVRRELGVTTGASAWLGSARTARADMVALGAELRVLPGWYAPRWVLALAFAYRPALATHVTHRALAKAAFGDDRYPVGAPEDARVDGPRDGWYRSMAHTLAVGLEAGGLIHRRISLYGGCGLLTPAGTKIVSFPDVAQLPFYARAGVTVWF
jgi:hypothetical protein